MRDFDETNITEAVLEQVNKAPDPRTRHICAALVRHLHAFVREVEPTFAEWETGVQFLTAVGQMCDDKRQEFILLSDALGVSMLVDAINHRDAAGTTQTTVLGPFYTSDPPEFPLGAEISGGMPGEPMAVSGSVSDQTGRAIPGATVDVWHSDDDGYYDVQKDDLDAPAMRARFTTDAQGRFHFKTVRPNYYPIPHDGPVGRMLAVQSRHPYRPAHVHFMISAPGYRKLVTHVFLAGDPYLDSDVVFGVKNELVREVARVSSAAPGEPDLSLTYDFILMGEG